jgi:hypothetical protein
LPNCNLFTQHVLFILWRDTTSELWTPVLFPLYCYHLFTLLELFTLLAYYYHFPLDTLISFVSSKPVRLTTSSQVENRVLGCVVCRFHVAISRRRVNKDRVNDALVGVLLSQSASPSVVYLSSPRSTYLGFLTEGKTLLLYSSHLPLGVPNGLVIYHASVGERGPIGEGRR